MIGAIREIVPDQADMFEKDNATTISEIQAFINKYNF